MAKFLKSVLHAGKTYVSPDRQVPVTRERLQHWADGFRKITAAKYNVPIDWDHGTTLDGVTPVLMSEQKKRRSAKNTIGQLSNFELAPDGNSAVLTLEVSDPVAQGRAERNEVYVSPVILDRWKDGHGNEYSDVITHVDFVNHPVDHSQGPFVKATDPGTVALAIRMGLDSQVCRLAFGDDDAERDSDGDGKTGEGDPPAADKDENADMPQGKDGDDKQLEAVLAHLRNDGYGLPSDTDATNLIERLLTACLTKEAIKQQATTEGEDEEEEESQPADKGETVVADPGFQAMSLYAENQHRAELTRQLDALLADGRCTPDEANKWKQGLGTIKLSLDAGGKQLVKSDLEKFVESRHAVPKGTFWSDEQRTRMSLSTVAEPHENFRGEQSAEDAERIADFVFGKAPAKA